MLLSGLDVLQADLRTSIKVLYALSVDGRRVVSPSVWLLPGMYKENKRSSDCKGKAHLQAVSVDVLMAITTSIRF